MKTKFLSREGASPSHDSEKQGGFGRADLIATVAVVGLLVVITAAGTSAERTASQSVACMENLRALTRAWQLFAIDKGYFPPNPDDGTTTPGYIWVQGSVGPGDKAEFNPDILADPARSLLIPYLTEKNVSIFRCPDDMRQGTYQGSDTNKIGTRVFAARSYGMNLAVGTDPYVRTAGTPVDGGWLDNNHSHTRVGKYRTYGRFDDIVDPSPANLVVLLDEDANSINDGSFPLGMEKEEWIDYPGSRHETGAVLSYADGRVELRRWVDPRTVVSTVGYARRMAVPGSLDYQWLRERISAPRTPSRPLIVPRPESFGPPAVRVVWPAQNGANYRVEFSDNLVTWGSLGTSVQASNNAVNATYPSPNTAGRFYRIIGGL